MCNIGVGVWSSIRYPNSISYSPNIRLEFPIFCGMYCEVRHRIGSVTNGSLAGLFISCRDFPLSRLSLSNNPLPKHSHTMPIV
jgi:hypothetical protein